MTGTTKGWDKRREKTPKEYLLARIRKTKKGCWIWTNKCGPKGYGSASYKGIVTSAHKMSFEAFKHKIKNGKHVLHKCDVPSCINPSHLYEGTQKDNTRDFYDRHPRAMEIRRLVGRGNSLIQKKRWKNKSIKEKKNQINLMHIGLKNFYETKRTKRKGRDDSIVKMRKRGHTLEVIGKKFHLTPAGVAAVIKRVEQRK